MDATSDPLTGDADAARVLAAIYRTRPGTVEELRAIRTLPADRLDELLATFEGLGLVEVSEGRLTVSAPDAAWSRRIGAQLADRAAELNNLGSFVSMLPGLVREWERGERGDDHPLVAEIVHGHEEQWRAWARHAAISPPRSPLNLYPDLDVLRDIVAPDAARAVADLPGELVPRAVVAAESVRTDGDRETLALMTSAGMDVRLAKRVDSWIYVDAGVLSAVPLIWGEHPPTSILIIRNESITAALSALVEREWERARPYDSASESWRDVMRLLELGMSDGAIAHAQSTSLRTVQRRIADAMTHYDVASRFELGMAWQADQREGSHR
ncbi:helix-turn-helix domain-containing protein [Aeromicrobium panaciterrae]|uniref:hypothetical protein n=1 Tax=Aeromicrobium panaciterrae TaxID=363861 RepID=UPI0031D224F0